MLLMRFYLKVAPAFVAIMPRQLPLFSVLPASPHGLLVVIKAVIGSKVNNI